MKVVKTLVVAFLLMAPTLLPAQKNSDQKIDKNDQLEIINEFSALLVKHYLYEDTARLMGKLLNDRLSSGAYQHIQSIQEFGRALTKDLQSNFRDRHIGIRYDPGMVKILKVGQKQVQVSQNEVQELLNTEIYENFRIPEVRRLNGNIGYLKIDQILPPQYATGYAQKLSAAMELIADTDAIILDLRENGGGFDEGVGLILSYFFESNTHILNSKARTAEGMKTEKIYAMQDVLGRRLLTQRVYVLTSSQTASAAEAIAHVMQYSNRGTIVGESTFGAGYLFDDHLVSEKFKLIAMIPYSAAVHPNATTNWESIGLKPQLETPQGQALETAVELAIKNLLTTEKSKIQKDKNTYRLTSLEWESNRLTDLKKAYQLSDQEIKEFIGNYASREITAKGAELFYQLKNPDRIKRRLIPVSKDEFLIEGLDEYRIKFNRNKKTNKVESIRVYSIDRLFIDTKD